jgi:Fe-Mn family superoxide dismutase
MIFTLPALQFDPSSLTPFCSKETFEFHHGKHHNAYITKLNDAIKGNPAYTDLSLEEVIKQSHKENLKPIYNNAAQHFNHSFFWNCMDPTGGKPGTKLSALIDRDFGSLDKFKDAFSATATALFGSGWTWLAQGKDGKLEILAMKDADTPLIVDKKPILTLDVWEHAYYIDHRNLRPKYIDEFWKFVNWGYVESQLS